jgi:signal transduction histidine kinase
MNTSNQISKLSLSVKALFERGIHFVYGTCIAPKSLNEDTKRREFILNMILVVIIPLLIILDLFIAVAVDREGKTYKGIPFLMFTFIVLLFMSLLFISRKGYRKVASFSLLILYFLATTYGAIHWGVELPLVAISYIVIIVISSILISTRFAFFATSIIAITIIWITKLQIQGILLPLLSWKHESIRINDPIQLSIIFFLITTISWLSNREIEASLLRARRSEALLLEERNQLEVTVEERTKEIKQMQSEKIAQLYRFAEFGRLSSGIFHDLMNSLHGVVQNVERLEHSTEQLPEVKDHLYKAVAASKRMGISIESVQKQISAKHMVSVFSLEKEINDVIDMLRFKSRHASVKIVFIIKQSVLLRGDALKFYQIILNLVGNAIEACDENTEQGTVSIMLDSDLIKKVAIVTISDNGCGIAPEIAQTIFTQFFTTKEYKKGIGIGLSQTKNYIEQDFLGTITVTSEHKKTDFIITIPLNEQTNHPHD